MKLKDPACSSCLASQFSLFSKCNTSELEVLQEVAVTHVFKKGEIVFHEGGLPHGLFCVNTGKVKLSKKNSEGREQIIRIAKGGDLIGFRSLLAESRFCATAIAMETVMLCFIPKDYFMELIETNPKFEKEVLKILSVSLGDAEERMARMAFKTVKERVAEALLWLQKIYNPSHEKNFAISISREDLASIVGTAKETAIRFLSEFKDQNIIKTSGAKIIITDEERLMKIGHMSD